MLDIYAGANALNIIKNQGIRPDLFTSFLGASGGPKWFTLFGLDKYLFGEFFKDRTQPLNVVGSSAGAFRTACFCTNDPVAAISKFAASYCAVTYNSKNPTPQEVTQSAINLVDSLFGDITTINEVINNPIFKAHFIVAKTKGLVASENKALQGLGLLKSYIVNFNDRKMLAGQYERFIYHSENSQLELCDPYNFKTVKLGLNASNFKESLLASGCIPLVMAGITDISGSPNGVYRDGGLIDYHFDFKFKNEGLTLYPHFNNIVKAGWFDKGLKRSLHPNSYDNTVLICPSKKFISLLPYQKISDRNDFKLLDDKKRISYWNEICNASETLAESFDTIYQQQLIQNIKPISLLNT